MRLLLWPVRLLFCIHQRVTSVMASDGDETELPPPVPPLEHGDRATPQRRAGQRLGA